MFVFCYPLNVIYIEIFYPVESPLVERFIISPLLTMAECYYDFFITLISVKESIQHNLSILGFENLGFSA